MANNLTDHDGYIIFGIEDQTYYVKGVPDTDRKTQQNVIDFLKSIKFAGRIRPTVYVKKIKIDDKPIDVLVVKNKSKVPYYLTENYQKVLAGNIYVRVGDTNTPKDMTADTDKVEYLWKKRFGMNLLPIERAKQLLSNLEDWEKSPTIPGFPKIYFNKFASEYTVTINATENDENDKKLTVPSIAEGLVYFCYANNCQTNISLFSYFKCTLKYSATILWECILINTNSCLYFIKPNAFYTLSLHISDLEIVDTHVTYYIKTDFNYLLDKFCDWYFYTNIYIPKILLIKNKDQICQTVLLFNDDIELKQFLCYTTINHNELEKRFIEQSNIPNQWPMAQKITYNPFIQKHIIECLNAGKVLVDWLEEFRRENYNVFTT
jgi:hypothetical protein